MKYLSAIAASVLSFASGQVCNQPDVWTHSYWLDLERYYANISLFGTEKNEFILADTETRETNIWYIEMFFNDATGALTNVGLGIEFLPPDANGSTNPISWSSGTGQTASDSPIQVWNAYDYTVKRHVIAWAQSYKRDVVNG